MDVFDLYEISIRECVLNEMSLRECVLNEMSMRECVSQSKCLMIYFII